MHGSRFSAVSAGMVQGVTMSPAVVPIYGVGWPCTGIFVEIGQGGSEFGDILKCFDYLKLTLSESRSEGAVGGC